MVYLDSSVLLRQLLAPDRAGPLRNPWGPACSSELIVVEGHRALDRVRVERRWDPVKVANAMEDLRWCLQELDRVPISPMVLERACRPFPVAVKSLDAIHLASALLWSERQGEAVHFLTHDRQLGLAARASGLPASGFPEK